jgi:hypothetical protein
MTSLARTALRRLARFVSGRPWLVGIAARAMATFPQLERHLRRAIVGPAWSPARSEASLSPEEARVLVDLREAMANRHGPRR